MADIRSSATEAVFPKVGLATATWTIPTEYGGMTSALLRRSRAFVEHAGLAVPVLTFDPTLDVDAARRRLEARGELVPHVTLHNAWEDVRQLPDARLGEPQGARLARAERHGRRGERVRVETDADGATRHLVYRADRSLAAIDERIEGHRCVTAVTRRGYRARTWRTLWVFYRWWLREVLREVPTTVIVDSKSLVRFFSRHPRRRIHTVHVVHGAHLTQGAHDAHGPVVPGREPLLRNLDAFDAVVFLTPTQRRDVVERMGDRGRTVVIPNSTEIPGGDPLTDRARGRGVMLASLVERKRVHDAVAAIGRLAAEGEVASLDVYGKGPERDALELLASGVEGVRLNGYDTRAVDQFATASFMMLTSRSEALPLVFAEAMARGCLPIAYDIRYGPADIVEDGVNGFLVPFADVDGLVAAVRRLLEMDEGAVLRMREAARATAARYSDRAVMAQWASLLTDISTARPLPAGE
jgi:poly(glycerol-phosphate) alpha-glucosyltransferase